VGLPYVARAWLEGAGVQVDVRCLQPGPNAKLKAGPIIASSGGAQFPLAVFQVSVHCAGTQRQATSRLTPPAPGRYSLSVELTDPNPIVLPLGTLVVDANQEMTLTLRRDAPSAVTLPPP
jgi:hypothetical protein